MCRVFKTSACLFLALFVFAPIAPLFAQDQPTELKNYADADAVQNFSDSLEERIKKYMFIVESVGFTLHELILDSDAKGFATLIFQGKISIPDKKFKLLAEKYADEIKLMTILKIIHERDKDAGYSLSPQQIVITTTIPPRVCVHFK